MHKCDKMVCPMCVGGGYDPPCFCKECCGKKLPCHYCNGTGRVWPSVRGERVITMPQNAGQYEYDSAVDDAADAIEDVMRSGCRIIVQPIKEEPNA